MESFISSISNTVSSYAKVYSMTSDDNEVASAPMMKELSDMTLASADDCEKILELLVGRLESDSAYTRVKALRIMRFICQRGRPEFRHELGRKTENVRACLRTSHSLESSVTCFEKFFFDVILLFSDYRGDLDELRGDAPNVAVRDAAKELMTAIFDQSANQSSNRMPGFGSGSMSSVEPTLGTGKKMTGFGSDSAGSYSDDRSEPSKQSGFYTSSSYTPKPYASPDAPMQAPAAFAAAAVRSL
jgi:hypothetical protein